MSEKELLSCGHMLQRKEGSIGSGYGYDDRGRKICYACCGLIDRETMMRSGRITLYLSKFSDKEWDALKVMTGGNITQSRRYKITNWPGTLVIQPFHVHTSDGWGWGGKYPVDHVAFIGPDGYEWYGRRAGNYNNLLHCKRKKKQSLSFAGVVWTTQNGRQLPLWKIEPAHLQNIINKIMRSARAGGRWGTLHLQYVEPMQKILDIKRRRGDPERYSELGQWHDYIGQEDLLERDPLQLEVTQ